jgi:hypothetical protein
VGLRVRGIHSGEARTISNSEDMRIHGSCQLQDYHETNETDEAINGTIARNIARIARSITRNTLPDVLGFTWNISNTIGKTIGNIS